MYFSERNYYCKCSQLKTIEHVLNECPLHTEERESLRNVSLELYSKIFLDAKKGIGEVVKFLDLLPQLFF